MSKIIVDKESLSKQLEGVRDGDLIELSIVPSQCDNGDFMPAFLHLAAIHTQEAYEDLENIDEFPLSFD